jgi:hypothetical protein
MYTDNQIIQIFLPILKAGLTSYGFENVPVVQANQPTMEGINTEPTVYFYKVANVFHGFPGWQDNWDGESMKHLDEQQILATFKIFALVLQFPSTPNQYTASDLVNAAASVFQSQNTVAQLKKSGIGILKISNIDNPYFADDRDQYEATPSFDFILSYKNSRILTESIVQLPVGLDIQPI